MEDAESRMRRYKKLGAASGARQANGSGGSSALSSSNFTYGNWRSSLAFNTRKVETGTVSSPSSGNNDDTDGISSHGDSTVNM